MDTTTLGAGPGRSLRSLREMAGLSLEALAGRAGVSASYLSRVENGKAIATPQWVGHVSQAIATHLQESASRPGRSVGAPAGGEPDAAESAS